MVDARGGWVVVDADHDAGAAPEPEYPDATSAILAASRELSARHGGGELLIHDRYNRVHARRCIPFHP
jgi:hypothetical protein